MQLDKTAVVISQRSGTELVDLSLVVMRAYCGEIALFAFLGILPFAILDLILMWPMTQYDSLMISSREISDPEVFHFRYLIAITALILIQAPLALSSVTYFIGQAVFIERPTVRQVFHSVWQRTVAMVYAIGILRMALLAFVPAVFLFLDPAFRPEIEIPLYLLLLCGYVFFIRGLRPFASEILLLERCPLRRQKNKPDQIVYSTRSRSLHSSLSNELLGVHFGVTMVEVLTGGSILLGIMFGIGVLTGIWTWGLWMDLFLFPMTIWVTSTWGTVIRFLLYMNSRIRTEGWEIELRLKAEAHRLEGLAR